MKNKKGQLDMILQGTLILLIAGFLFVVGLIMLDKLMTAQATTSANVGNESIIVVANTTTSVAEAGRCGFSSFSVTYATNESYSDAAADLGAGNYTFSDRGTVIIGTGDDYMLDTGVTNTWHINYTYSSDESEACSATNATLGGQGSFADYWDLIVLAIVITVIISLLLVVFSMRTVK